MQYVHYLDPFIYNDLLRFELDLTSAIGGPKSFTGVINIPFYIDLKSICGDRLCDIYETYNGALFAIRHTVYTRVQMSWYQFDIEVARPVYICKYSSDCIEKSSLSVEIPLCDDYDVQLENIAPLALPGSHLWLQSDSIDISGELTGSILLNDLLCPIDYLQLKLLKVEYVANIPIEHVVYVHDVFGIPSESTVQDIDACVPRFSGYTSRRDVGDEEPRPTDPVNEGSIIEFHIKPPYM